MPRYRIDAVLCSVTFALMEAIFSAYLLSVPHISMNIYAQICLLHFHTWPARNNKVHQIVHVCIATVQIYLPLTKLDKFHKFASGFFTE